MIRDLAIALLATLVLYARPDLPRGDAGARQPARPRLVADNGGAFRELVLHYTPAMEQDAGPSYRDMLRAIAPDVKVRVVVERGEHFQRFLKLASGWGMTKAAARLSPVLVGLPITTWARDRYSLARRGSQRVLMVRPRPHDHGPPQRRNDWQAPFALARTVSRPGQKVEVSKEPLIFDGGDLTATSRFVFATSLLLARNRGGALDAVRPLRRWLRQTTGLEPVIIGRTPGDIPGHHIGMFVTPIDDRVVLVGDAEAGLELAARLPGARDLPLDRDPATVNRFRRVAEDLRRQGFEVVKIPLVPLADGLTYITYNNVLLERRPGSGLHVYMPHFGIPTLDALGRAAYEARGITVHEVDVSRIYRHNGTVRCLFNVLDRSR